MQVWGPTMNKPTRCSMTSTIVERLRKAAGADLEYHGFGYCFEGGQFDGQLLNETGYLSLTERCGQSTDSPTDFIKSTTNNRERSPGHVLHLRFLRGSESKPIHTIARPKTIVINDTNPPEVVRVKIQDSETQVAEQIGMEILGILTVVDSALKAERWKSWRPRGSITHHHGCLPSDIKHGPRSRVL